MESTIIRNVFITAAFYVPPQRSIPKEIMFSNTAITVEYAANVIKIKNSEPHILPPAIELKILGSVTNISLSSPGSTLKEKQAGK